MSQERMLDIQRIYVPLAIVAALLGVVYMAASELGDYRQALASVRRDIDGIDRRIVRMEDKLDRVLFVKDDEQNGPR